MLMTYLESNELIACERKSNHYWSNYFLSLKDFSCLISSYIGGKKWKHGGSVGN